MTEKWKAIVVDDEQSARNILVNLLQPYSDKLEVVATCESVNDALAAIQLHKPNLVFLDIEMPNYNGFELLNMLGSITFEIIFITAYQQFALKAFEVAAFDYLLKPIEIQRLDAAIRLFLDSKTKESEAIKYRVLQESLQDKSISKMIVQHAGSNRMLELKEIIAIEANEAYTTITDSQMNRYTLSKNLKHFENLLSENMDFFRVHKSWIVNKKWIESYNVSQLEIVLQNGIIAKLSKYRKAEFETWYMLS